MTRSRAAAGPGAGWAARGVTPLRSEVGANRQAVRGEVARLGNALEPQRGLIGAVRVRARDQNHTHEPVDEGGGQRILGVLGGALRRLALIAVAQQVLVALPDPGVA